MTAPLTIGFVGLGVMGVPMARHLGESGHRVQGFDVTPRALQRLRDAHAAARACGSAREAATGADVVFTMLPNGHVVQNRSAVEAVLLEVGTRTPGGDSGTYSDIDMHFRKGGYFHRDGTPYPKQDRRS